MSLSGKKGLIILRERIFISHITAEDRIITHEFTLLNQSDHSIPSVLLPRTEFMLGLKIFDEKNNELPFYTNEMTKKLLSNQIEYAKILDDIKKQNKFVLWIRLNDNNVIKQSESKIIKLQYKNQTPTENIKFRNSFFNKSKLKFLFSIPTFRSKYSKDEGLGHDIFFIISIPEGYELDYEILQKHRKQTITSSVGTVNIKTEIRETELTAEHKVYIDRSKNIISIRIPPVKESLIFDMIYDVIPEKNERLFYSFFLFSLVGLALIFCLVSTNIIDDELLKINSIFPLKYVSTNINYLLGGITTVAIAAIGFMRSCSLNRTRFWFIIPIVLSAIGFLFKDILKL